MLGFFLRLFSLQPELKQRRMVSSASYRRSLSPEAKAIARYVACFRTTCAPLCKLRSGEPKYPVRSSQCCITIASILAYTSHKIPYGFSLRHSSMPPWSFHSLNSSSICHRIFINTNASCSFRSSGGADVTYTFHFASARCRLLSFLPL